MSVDDETLMAFADGELSEVERAAVEAALAEDPVLRGKLEAQRLLRARLSAAFDCALTEPLPSRLAAAVQPREADIVSLAHRRAERWSVREWGAMAASLAAGLLIGFSVMNTQTRIIRVADGGLEASGVLAHALDTQLASDEPGAVRIGLSFAAQGGGYCRTFSVTKNNTSGLACREGDVWSVAMTAQGGGGVVRMAAAPEAVMAAVDAMIVGEPLDQAGEERARAQGWRYPN